MNLIYTFLFLFAMVSTVMMAPRESDSYSYSDSDSDSDESRDTAEHCSIEEHKEGTLESIILFESHAAVGPKYDLPKIAKDPSCKIVFNQVTPAGINQTRRIANLIKHRYGSLTNDPEAYFRSTNVQRCLDTIGLIIESYFPTKEGIESIPPVFFNPPRELDGLYEGVYCPAADKEINIRSLASGEGVKFVKKTKKMVDYLAEHTGLPADIFIFRKVFDYLSSLRFNGCELPSFYNHKLYDEIERRLVELEILQLTDLAQKLKAGPAIQELIKRVDYYIDAANQKNSTEAKIPQRKLHVVVTHPLNLASILVFLRHDIEFPVRSGNTIIVELHRVDGKYYLRFYYLFDTETSPIGRPKKLEIKGSTEEGISVEKFKELAAGRLPTNFDRECKIPCSFDYHYNLELFMSEVNDDAGSRSIVRE